MTFTLANCLYAIGSLCFLGGTVVNMGFFRWLGSFL